MLLQEGKGAGAETEHGCTRLLGPVCLVKTCSEKLLEPMPWGHYLGNKEKNWAREPNMNLRLYSFDFMDHPVCTL